MFARAKKGVRALFFQNAARQKGVRALFPFNWRFTSIAMKKGSDPFLRLRFGRRKGL